MRIEGEWLQCDDGVIRPTIRIYVQGVDGRNYADDFLIDTGADRTTFSADFLRELRLVNVSPPLGAALHGIGGATLFVLVRTTIQFTCDDGRPVTVRGEFAAFTDPTATDLSILGRDVLNIFDIIISRRRNEVLLLAPNHQYHVSRV